ncbi:hypothetical protein [Streptomyces albidoflavus]|uniref:hypothetical protein n=1 Tax=Streptomyces albidoflavus TaxID=1886 RepID=UPI00331749D0
MKARLGEQPLLIHLVAAWWWGAGGREDRKFCGLAVVDPFDHADFVAVVGQFVEFLPPIRILIRENGASGVSGVHVMAASIVAAAAG